MERSMPSSEYEYVTLMNMLHVSVSKHLLDEHFTVVWANDFYYELIGYDQAEYEALHRNQCDRYYVEDKEEWEKIANIVSRALENQRSGYSFFSRLRRKGGKYIWVRIAGTFTQEYIGDFRVSYTVITDINDIMLMKLERSVTYDTFPGFVGKFRVNKDFGLVLLDANERFIDFFGQGDIKNAKDILFPLDLEQSAEDIELYKRQLWAGEPIRLMTKIQGWRGDFAWLQVDAVCVDRQGEHPVYLIIYVDVTNETEMQKIQKQLEKKTEQLSVALKTEERASRAKSDFLSHMSHDIRTPMNAIIGMTDIARSHLDNPVKMQDCLNKISLSSQHLLGLINDVLDMSRIENGKIMIENAPMSLSEVLKNVVAIIQPSIKSKNQQFFIRLHNVRHENFFSDALHLRQIFINILSNASKFTPVGGSISLDVEEKNSENPHMSVMHFTFADSGIGMHPNFLEHLFAPFTRERDGRVDKTEGSGLGMAITKKLVDLFKGTIEVQSQPGKGTTFYVALPIFINELTIESDRFSDLKVIVVDDDAAICEHMIETLGKAGIRLDTAANGLAALEKIEAAHRLNEDYDGVFLDWKMPGMNGPETARRIRAQIGRNLPILIVSAYDWSDIEDEAIASGVNGFVPKPLFISTICYAIQKYILSQQTNQEFLRHTDRRRFSGQRFLLVEDNELNREIAVELLSASGAEVDCACDGAEGVEKFKNSSGKYYSLILMDVQMPVMNGYEATELIRSLPHPNAGTVPILAMTADAFAEDIIKAKKVGMNGHLAKPLDVATLRNKIGEALETQDV